MPRAGSTTLSISPSGPVRLARFNWLDYLDVAEQLLAQKDEKYLRSAASRAYYAVFGFAKEPLEARMGRPIESGGGDHREVIRLLRGDSDDALVQSGMNLDRLRAERLVADYDSDAAYVYSRATLSIRLAQKVQSGLEAART